MTVTRVWFIAACALFAAFMVGCGGDDDDTDNDATIAAAVDATLAVSTPDAPTAESTRATTATVAPATTTPSPPAPTATEAPATSTPEPPTATTTSQVSDAELIDLAEATFPRVAPATYVGCDTRADYECPVTEILGLFLDDPELRLCRCQNFSDTREIEVLEGRDSDGGGIVRVTLFGGSTSFDLVVIRELGQWLVDDVYCAGRPETTIVFDPGPC